MLGVWILSTSTCLVPHHHICQNWSFHVCWLALCALLVVTGFGWNLNYYPCKINFSSSSSSWSSSVKTTAALLVLVKASLTWSWIFQKNIAPQFWNNLATLGTFLFGSDFFLSFLPTLVSTEHNKLHPFFFFKGINVGLNK